MSTSTNSTAKPAEHYENPPHVWGDKNALDAAEEGWGLFYAEGRTEIQRVDESELLESDNAAKALVLGMAEQGSRLHLKALRLVMAEHPTETGLTPRQLAEQRAELLERLAMLLDSIAPSAVDSEHMANEMGKARAAIARAESRA